MRKILLSLIVVVLAVAVWLLTGNKNAISPSVSPTLSVSPTFNPTPMASSVSTASPTKTSTPTSIPVRQGNLVTYTNSGYSPATLTIKKGQIITWKNESSKPMWTASAIHPTHSVYPTTGGCLGSTFDACTGTSSGQEWSFKFDVVGTWNYHNHLHAIYGGKIIVQ